MTPVRSDLTPAAEDWHTFVATLVRHARRLLRPRTRPVVDPEDVVASALGSYLARREAKGVPLKDNLLDLLLDCVNRHCEKWNMRSRRHPSASLQTAERELAGDIEPPAPTSLEEQTRGLDELLEWLAQDLIDIEKEILLLLIAGLSCAEIGLRVGRVERTIRRCRDKVVRKLRARTSEEL